MSTVIVEPAVAPFVPRIFSAKPIGDSHPFPCEAEGSFTISNWGVSSFDTARTHHTTKLADATQKRTVQRICDLMQSSSRNTGRHGVAQYFPRCPRCSHP